MFLNGSIATIGPALPTSLKNRIYLRTTCEFLPEEIQAISIALVAFERALIQDKSVPESLYLNAFFINTDEFSISLNQPEVRGQVCSFAIYPLNRWRADHLNHIQMVVVTLEELCHHFWSIRDESLVEYKVLDVIHQVYPNVLLSEIYNPHP